MLRITIPSNGPAKLTFSSFENEDLPKPPNGIDVEVNNNVILLFDDEEEAIDFADGLEDISNSINDNTSPVKLAINDIIMAIKNNKFIQDYLE
ncbi:MAG: hypothetical protein JWR67_2298 [Mucilaginibacter sp.]|nr:hypothetical protein [Mucilaginibacter sp.]MDB5111184.1 hypothetical protein [Mucilaginibacter sp.]